MSLMGPTCAWKMNAMMPLTFFIVFPILIVNDKIQWHGGHLVIEVIEHILGDKPPMIVMQLVWLGQKVSIKFL